MKIKYIFILIGFIVLISIISVVFYINSISPEDVSSTNSVSTNTTEDMVAAASKMGLILPEGAQPVGVYQEEGIDSLMQMKITISDNGLMEFLSRNTIDPVNFKEDQRSLLLPDNNWWDPSTATTLPTTQVQREDGATLTVGQTRNPDGVVELYIMWFTK